MQHTHPVCISAARFSPPQTDTNHNWEEALQNQTPFNCPVLSNVNIMSNAYMMTLCEWLYDPCLYAFFLRSIIAFFSCEWRGQMWEIAAQCSHFPVQWMDESWKNFSPRCNIRVKSVSYVIYALKALNNLTVMRQAQIF